VVLFTHQTAPPVLSLASIIRRCIYFGHYISPAGSCLFQTAQPPSSHCHFARVVAASSRVMCVTRPGELSCTCLSRLGCGDAPHTFNTTTASVIWLSFFISARICFCDPLFWLVRCAASVFVSRHNTQPPTHHRSSVITRASLLPCYSSFMITTPSVIATEMLFCVCRRDRGLCGCDLTGCVEPYVRSPSNVPSGLLPS
jgi:hypothetical protein